jgi:hypothetical protein
MKKLFSMAFLFGLLFSANTISAQAFQDITVIPNGKGLIYFYRPSSMVGALVSYTVNVNDGKVSEARLKNGTYLVYFAAPGIYSFWAMVAETKREVKLSVEAGKTYYIKGDCCEFILTDEVAARGKIVKCKLSTP